MELRGPELVPLRADRLRIGQVIANLLSNALKYSQGKPIEGCIRIPARPIRLKPEVPGMIMIRIRAYRESRRKTRSGSSTASSARSRPTRSAAWAWGSTSAGRSSRPTTEQDRGRERHARAKARGSPDGPARRAEKRGRMRVSRFYSSRTIRTSRTISASSWSWRASQSSPRSTGRRRYRISAGEARHSWSCSTS